MEAVNLLRSCVVSKLPVGVEGDKLVMAAADGARIGYPLQLPTPIVDPKKNQQFTLGAIWLVYSMYGQGVGALMKEAMKLQLVGGGQQLPTIAYQPAIISFLKGTSAATDIIDQQKVVELAAEAASSKVIVEPGSGPSSGAGTGGPTVPAGTPGKSSSASSSGTGSAAAPSRSSSSSSSAAAASGGSWIDDDPTCLALMARAGEQLWLTRNTVLDAPNPRGTYLRDFVFAQFHHKEEEAQRAMAKASAAATKQAADQARAAGQTAAAAALQQQLRGRFSNTRATAAAAAATRTDKGPRGTPIIIVPASATSLVNMYNAKQLLQEGRFVPPAEAKAAFGAAPRPSKLEIFRQDARTGYNRKYYVVDSVQQFRSGDWGKIVAVFALGADWQFKGWRWGRQAGRPDVTPAEVFDRVAGFHMYYAGADTPNCVRRWALTPLPIQRSTRHSDSQQVGKFWTDVERFIHVKRPTLAVGREDAAGGGAGAGGSAAVGSKRGRSAGRKAGAGAGGGSGAAEKRART